MKKGRLFRCSVMAAVLFACLSLPGIVSAREIDGVQLPDSLTVAGIPLVLNGAGIRTKFFFHVYAGALYLQTPSHDAGAIIAGDAPMLVRMHFIYDGVTPEEMQNGWMKGFRRLAPHADRKLQAAMHRFTQLFSVTVKKNDVYDFAWIPGKGLEVRFNDKVLDVIDNIDLKKVLFRIWFGKDPADKDLKEGMLGCKSSLAPRFCTVAIARIEGL
ncbi:MAG TPA: hypothetical protein ENK89_06670 [Desulfobulbaceae bacterium]|nr:hypothetical protein [Desulfobulbaceae bacterium]